MTKKLRYSIYTLLVAFILLGSTGKIGAYGSKIENPISAASIDAIPEIGWLVWETASPIQRLTAVDETVWAGSYKDGLSVWQLDQGPTAVLTTSNGLPGLDVLSIAFDSSNKQWVSTLDGGLASSEDGESFTPVDLPVSLNYNDWALATHNDEVWLATLGSGVGHFVDGAWTTYNRANSTLPYDDIYAVAVASDGTPWIGTVGYGAAAAGWAIGELSRSDVRAQMNRVIDLNLAIIEVGAHT